MPFAAALPAWRGRVQAVARRCRVLLAALVLAGAAGAPGAQPVPGDTLPRPALRIGVLAYLGSEAAVEEWAPVARQLAAALPGHRVELRYLDHQAIDQAAQAQTLDFIITNPGHYTELETRLGAARMLTLQTGPVAAGSAYQAVGAAVVTRAERTDIQRLSDLRGLRVAIVGQEAFAGYQAPWRELVGAGIAGDLRALQVVGLPMDRVLDAVASGEADAGFVRACMIESRPDWQARFRVVAPLPAPGFPCQASTRLYPNWPIATLRHTPAPLAKAVAIALLEVAPASSPISWTVPADYQAVHALMRELQMCGKTVVTVLHDLNQASRYCDHLVVLESGKVRAQGLPEQVLRPALLRSVFQLEAEIHPDPISRRPMCVMK